MSTTWDAAHKHSSVTLSNGNLTASIANPGFTARVPATAGCDTSSKKYWEIHVDSWDSNLAPAVGIVGAAESTMATAPGYDADDVGYVNLLSGAIIRNSSSLSTVGQYGTGVIIGIAVDGVNRTIDFYLSGTHLYQATGANVPSGTLYPAVGTTGNGSPAFTANFGASAFTYTPPTGFTGFDTPPFTYTGDVSIDVEPAAVTGDVYANTGDVSIDAEIASPGGYGFWGVAELDAELSSPYSTAANAGAGPLPLMTSAGHGYTGIVGRGAAIAPHATSSGLGSALPNEALMAPIGASGTGLTGIIGSGAATFSRIVAAATGSLPGQGSGAAILSAMRASGSGVATIVGTGTATFRRILASGAGATGAAVILAQVPMGAIHASGTGFAQITGSGAATFPLLVVDARAVLGDLAISRIVAMMAASSACTEYSGWDFNSFAVYRGAVLGAGAAGVVQLEGADDAGTAIDAFFSTGECDHGTDELKRPTDLYAGIQTDGVMVATVTAKRGKVNETYEYEMEAGEDEADARKADLGRGFKGRYLKYGLKNTDGCGFHLDAMTALVQNTGRRA